MSQIGIAKQVSIFTYTERVLNIPSNIDSEMCHSVDITVDVGQHALPRITSTEWVDVTVDVTVDVLWDALSRFTSMEWKCLSNISSSIYSAMCHSVDVTVDVGWHALPSFPSTKWNRLSRFYTQLMDYIVTTKILNVLHKTIIYCVAL